MSYNIATVYSMNQRICHVDYLIPIAHYFYTCVNNFMMSCIVRK